MLAPRLSVRLSVHEFVRSCFLLDLYFLFRCDNCSHACCVRAETVVIGDSTDNVILVSIYIY